MMFKLPRLPLRRYRHGAGRAVRDAVSALLHGMTPQRRPGGAVVSHLAAPSPAGRVTPDDAHDAWSRFQSGIAAGG
ncbi:hypothetical protein ACFQS7_15630 [Dankookia sp. GCM10030260]|uniref:hypothetical protein n=1 Tax=Dankookia sp. GCM10030260 TaxID=3273390 RepID=UPI00360CC26C